MKVSSILKGKGRTVVTVRPDASLASAIRELTEKGIGALVVSEDDRSVRGLISERDIVQALARFGPLRLDLRVSDVMMAHVVTCHQDDTITKVMDLMTRHRVRHLPVVEEGQLRGLVSIGDVVKHRLDELETETNVLREAFIGRQ
ncbi:MAG: CBS domain-containing protein [Candidatus Rokuibacteriota bacterium]